MGNTTNREPLSTIKTSSITMSFFLQQPDIFLPSLKTSIQTQSQPASVRQWNIIFPPSAPHFPAGVWRTLNFSYQKQDVSQQSMLTLLLLTVPLLASSLLVSNINAVLWIWTMNCETWGWHDLFWATKLLKRVLVSCEDFSWCGFSKMTYTSHEKHHIN